MDNFPTNDHGLILRRDALDRGFTDNHLARATRAGTIRRIWPGAFVPATSIPTKPEDLHRLRSLAAVELSEGGFALSHESAALQHGLSLLHPRLERVHFATGAHTGGRIEKHRHLHSGPLDTRDITAIGDLTVTSLERTVIDVACSNGFAQALAVLDSGLRRGADAEVLADLLADRRRGVTHARRALSFADPGAENAGESWGRAQMINAGLPVPRLQHEFYDPYGIFIARTDYDWMGKLVGEFDGMTKYQKHLRDGDSPFDVMQREKAREDALRRLGIQVVRWIWDDLRHGRVVPMVRGWLERLGITA